MVGWYVGYLSIYLFVYLSVYLSIYLSICLSLSLSPPPSIYIGGFVDVPMFDSADTDWTDSSQVFFAHNKKQTKLGRQNRNENEGSYQIDYVHVNVKL